MKNTSKVNPRVIWILFSSKRYRSKIEMVRTWNRFSRPKVWGIQPTQIIWMNRRTSAWQVASLKEVHLQELVDQKPLQIFSQPDTSQRTNYLKCMRLIIVVYSKECWNKTQLWTGVKNWHSIRRHHLITPSKTFRRVSKNCRHWSNQVMSGQCKTKIFIWLLWVTMQDTIHLRSIRTSIQMNLQSLKKRVVSRIIHRGSSILKRVKLTSQTTNKLKIWLTNSMFIIQTKWTRQSDKQILMTRIKFVIMENPSTMMEKYCTVSHLRREEYPTWKFRTVDQNNQLVLKSKRRHTDPIPNLDRSMVCTSLKSSLREVFSLTIRECNTIFSRMRNPHLSKYRVQCSHLISKSRVNAIKFTVFLSLSRIRDYQELSTMSSSNQLYLKM